MAVLLKMFSSIILVFMVSCFTLSTVDAEHSASSPRDQEASYCLLPPYPNHGRYIVSNYPSATPGESYSSVKLDVSCNIGYQNVNNTNSIFCINGDWSATMPTCARFCTLINDLSVEYRCVLSNPGFPKGSRECESLVPSGTVVTPICRSPNYFFHGELPKMHCIEGSWDYIAICIPECGIISPDLQLTDTSNNHLELPWHVGIYRKFSEPYMQTCGGSLISSNTVITAAHCFCDYNDEVLSESNYAVAVGKLYRSYNDPRDKNSQQSDVSQIKIPSSYRGKAANYQNDIAIVVVGTPFIFQLSVRPVCFDFNYNLDRTLLAAGNRGKAAGWNIGGKKGQLSPVLKVADILYIKFEDCYDISPSYFRDYLTNDKFCAGSYNGTSLCEGDSGGGLAFFESTSQRYYLRGVISVGLFNEDDCSTLNFYTSILKNEDFIKEHLQ